MLAGPGMCELLVNHFERITLTAGEARANFFVVIPDDLGTSGERWRESIGGTGYLGSNNPLEGIEHLEGSTRAVRLPLDATGTGALVRVAQGEFGVLRGGTRARPRDEAYGRSRSLDVRVKRPGVTVRVRPAITFEPPARAGDAPKLSLTDLLLSRTSYTDLRLRTAAFTVRQPDGRLRVGVVVETDDPGASLDVARGGAARRRRARRGPVVRRRSVRSGPCLGRCWRRPARTGCGWWPSTRSAGSARPRRPCRLASPPSARSRSARWCWASRAATG